MNCASALTGITQVGVKSVTFHCEYLDGEGECRFWHPSWRLHLSYWQIKNMWKQCKWRDWFWKTIKTQFKIYPLHWSDLWKLYPTLSMYNWDTAVCAWSVPRNVMEVHKNWYLQVPFHFFSHLKEEQTGSLEPW